MKLTESGTVEYCTMPINKILQNYISLIKK